MLYSQTPKLAFNGNATYTSRAYSKIYKTLLIVCLKIHFKTENAETLPLSVVHK